MSVDRESLILYFSPQEGYRYSMLEQIAFRVRVVDESMLWRWIVYLLRSS